MAEDIKTIKGQSVTITRDRFGNQTIRRFGKKGQISEVQVKRRRGESFSRIKPEDISTADANRLEESQRQAQRQAFIDAKKRIQAKREQKIAGLRENEKVMENARSQRILDNIRTQQTFIQEARSGQLRKKADIRQQQKISQQSAVQRAKDDPLEKERRILNKITAQEQRFAVRSEQIKESARPIIPGDNYFSEAGRYFVTLPATLGMNVIGTTVKAGRSLSLGIRSAFKGQAGAVGQEMFKDAPSKVPRAVGEGFDPRTPEGVVNLITLGVSLYVGGASGGTTRASTVKPSSVKSVGTRSFTNQKTGRTTFVEKGTAVSKSGQPLRFDIRTAIDESGVGESFVRIKDTTGQILSQGSQRVRVNVKTNNNIRTTTTEIKSGLFNRRTNIVQVEDIFKTEPVFKGQTLNIREISEGVITQTGRAGRFEGRTKAVKTIKTQGRVVDEAFIPSNIAIKPISQSISIKAGSNLNLFERAIYESTQTPYLFSVADPVTPFISSFRGLSSDFTISKPSVRPVSQSKTQINTRSITVPSLRTSSLQLSRPINTGLNLPIATTRAPSLAEDGAFANFNIRLPIDNISQINSPSIPLPTTDVPVTTTTDSPVIDDAFVPSTPTPTPASPPVTSGGFFSFPAPIIFPRISVGGGFSIFNPQKPSKKTKTPVGFTPSVFASVFNITGERSFLGEISGLGVRPIQRGKKR